MEKRSTMNFAAICYLMLCIAIGLLLGGCYSSKEVDTVPVATPPAVVQVPEPVAPATSQTITTTTENGLPTQQTTTTWDNGAVVQRQTTTDAIDGTSVQKHTTTTWNNGAGQMQSQSTTTTTTTP